jgi:integrase
VAAKTGQGFEKHGNKYRVKVREKGQARYVSFGTAAEAHAFATSLAAHPDRRIGLSPLVAAAITGRPSTPPLVDYARDVFKGRTLKRNTQDMYETALRRIEREPLGAMEVAAVGPRQIREFFGAMEKNRANIKAVLDMTFTAAKREGLIRISPMETANIKLPNRRQKNIKPLTAAEVDRVAEAAGNDRDALAIRLGGFAGLRAGEVGGLRVDDIDFERRRIHIRRNAQRYTKREGDISSIHVGSPKSQTSERTVEVDSDLIEDLVAYIETNRPLADGTIFRTVQGNPVTDQVLTYNLIRATKAAGLQRATFHDLRHAYATNLALNGLPMPVLQRVMGWSSIRMTDTYAHLQDEAVGAAAVITARLRNGDAA